jgi:hypothetical protein
MQGFPVQIVKTSLRYTVTESFLLLFMIREVVHDPILLGMKSKPATKEDLQVAQDLLDTLIANKDACVGMAANMIGFLALSS